MSDFSDVIDAGETGRKFPLVLDPKCHCWHIATIQYDWNYRKEACCHCGAMSTVQVEERIPEGHGKFCVEKAWRTVKRVIAPRAND